MTYQILAIAFAFLSGWAACLATAAWLQKRDETRHNPFRQVDCNVTPYHSPFPGTRGQ